MGCTASVSSVEILPDPARRRRDRGMKSVTPSGHQNGSPSSSALGGSIVGNPLAGSPHSPLPVRNAVPSPGNSGSSVLAAGHGTSPVSPTTAPSVRPASSSSGPSGVPATVASPAAAAVVVAPSGISRKSSRKSVASGRAAAARPARASGSESDDDAHLSSISSLEDIAGQSSEAPAEGAANPHGSSVDLNQQREDTTVDLTQEFFVWDDMRFDVQQEKRNRAALMRRPNTATVFLQQQRALQQQQQQQHGEFVFNDFTIDLVDEMSTIDVGMATQALSKARSEVFGRGVSSTRTPGTHARVGMSPTGKNAAAAATFLSRFQGDDSHKIVSYTLTTQVGHSARVKVLAIAPGEKEYVSASSEDSLVTYFDMSTGRELGIFSGHQDTVIFATFSACGKFLATTSRDNTMILWDVVTQKAILTFEHARVVICCCFSKDSKYIATGCQDKVCRLWETRKGKEVASFAQHDGIIICMSYSPDGTHIVSASSDKTLRVWNAMTPPTPPGAAGKDAAMAALAASSSSAGSNTGNVAGKLGSKAGSPLATAAAAAAAAVAAAAAANPPGKQRALLQGHSGIILSCQHTADGSHIVSNDEKTLKVWRVADFSCVRTLVVDEVVRLRNLAPSKKLTWTLSCAAPQLFPNYFIVACNNRFVFVYDIAKGEEALSVYCKAPVYCLTSGTRNSVMCGDSFGNVFTIKLENPVTQLADPPSGGAVPATPMDAGLS